MRTAARQLGKHLKVFSEKVEEMLAQLLDDPEAIIKKW